MDTDLVLAHAGLAVILFLCMNWIGKHSLNAGYIQMSVFVKTDEAPAFNFLYRSFAPIVFITLVSALAYKLKLEWIVSNIYLVVIYHSVFRLGFNLLTGRARLLNWGMQLAYILISTGGAYYIYSNLIIDKAFFFPAGKDIGNALWLGVIGFIYHTCNSVRASDAKTRKRKEGYLNATYLKYKKLYGKIINDTSENEKQESLIYSVLIYENFNRPQVYRLVENLLFFFGLAKTLGVMQVTTEDFINDRESVVLGSKKIVSDFNAIKDHPEQRYGYWPVRRLVLKSYNPDDDYISEVARIDDELKKLFYLKKETNFDPSDSES